MTEEINEEPILFTNEELYAAINKHLGLDSAPESEPDRRPHPDPGTITTVELRERYDLSKVMADKTRKELVGDGVLFPDWVFRYDKWPPHNRIRLKGYRYTNTVPTEETQLDKQ
jgi:hypothetical protein